MDDALPLTFEFNCDILFEEKEPLADFPAAIDNFVLSRVAPFFV